MIVSILKILGVTPDGSKTGKRETAWMLVFIALTLTVGAVFLTVDKIAAFQPVLLIIWPSAIAMVAVAYKLEFDAKQGVEKGIDIIASDEPELD